MARHSGFKKIEGIRYLDKYRLPKPETIFIFDFKKQEKEIDDFLKNKRIVTIRSDKKGKTDFCPVLIGCKRKEAKKFIKNLIAKGYAAILQQYVPVKVRVSGNILILRKHFLVELMGEGPLTWLNREGQVEEQAKFLKSNFKETEHFGKRLLSKNDLVKILKLVKAVPARKLLEFTLRPEGLYFWQAKTDRTAQKLER